MKKTVYFVHGNGYDYLISDDGITRRVLADNEQENLFLKRDRAEEFLREEVEDDSSWQEVEETIKDLIDECDTVIAKCEIDL